MTIFTIVTVSHLALAVLLFFGVNWIGEHAEEFGYASTTLFEDAKENVALNFFLRAMSPAVFIIALSALSVAIGRPEWRLGIHWVAIYYYVFRAGVIIVLNRQRLISWSRFAVHAAAGISFAMIAYHYLIVPNRSLLPDLEQMGNELWLAILAFLYAVANKVPLPGGPGAKRRNGFVTAHYERARSRFGNIIDARVSDDRLKLIVYGVLVYEDYARPAMIRTAERLMLWKKNRTTGIMQVAADKPLTDIDSVMRGTDLLAQYWGAHAGEEYAYDRVRMTIADYNADDDYISRVMEVMEIIAKRADQSLRPAYEMTAWGVLATTDADGE